MNHTITTTLVDLGILLALAALALGIWFCPWITVLVIALMMLGGLLFGQHPD